MTTNYVTTVANSAVQSLYIGENGLAFNSKTFTKSLYSAETISGAIGAGVTAGLGGINLRDGNNITLNSNTFNVGGIKALNGLAGGLVQNGVALAMGGNANFNLLSFKGVGLLEFSFGKDGVSSKIGMGGTNISIQNLRAAVAGYKEASKVTDWKYGNEQSSSTLNSINMLGYTTSGMNQQLAKDIWNEKLAVEYGDTGNDYGNYTIGESKIVLSENLLGGGREASAKLATVMSHEGSHYKGNRVEALAHLAGSETYAQLNQKFNLQADTSFSMEMLSGIMNADNWKENTGDVDHWTLMDDGSLAYDGKANLYDENGNLIYKTEKTGLEGSLIEILYGENATKEQKNAAIDLLEKNFSHYVKGGDANNRDNWYWNTNANEGKSISVDQYQEIYETRVLKDSTTGFEGTIEQHNPRNIYDNMVANEKMDIRQEYQGLFGGIKAYMNNESKYISYEEFKDNNFITGGMPEYQVNSPVPIGSDISTLFGASGTNAAGTLKTHAGIDWAVISGTEVYPLLVNENTFVSSAQFTDNWLKEIQGKHLILQSNYNYNYKGYSIEDNIFQSYDHMSSSSLIEENSVSQTTLLGLSGNTGQWNGNGYGAHLHVDIYSNLDSSPLLNYVNIDYQNLITDTLSHQSSLNTKPMQYYDPLSLLADFTYKIRHDAYTY